VLKEKYHFDVDNAMTTAKFLLPMLELTPSERANAGGMSNHAFLDATPGMENIKMDQEVGSKGEGIKGWAAEIKRQ